MTALSSHQFDPGSNPGVNTACELSLLLVLSFASGGFSPGNLVFSLLKNQHFQISIQPGNQVDEEPLADMLPLNHYVYI